MAHPGGRPLKFQSVQELQEKIDAYFAECDPHMFESEEWEVVRNSDGTKVKDENGYDKLALIKRKRMTGQVPYTVTGLALALDTTRETLIDYENGNRDLGEDDENYDPDVAKFSDTIKRAKEKIHNYLEKNLNSPSPTGTIFNLKNNYGWKDKTETDITSGGEKIQGAMIEFINSPKANNTSTDIST